MKGEPYLFPIHDPEFSVQSWEDYTTLMGWLAKTTLELAEEYPDHPILVTYLVGEE